MYIKYPELAEYYHVIRYCKQNMTVSYFHIYKMLLDEVVFENQIINFFKMVYKGAASIK